MERGAFIPEIHRKDEHNQVFMYLFFCKGYGFPGILGELFLVRPIADAFQNIVFLICRMEPSDAGRGKHIVGVLVQKRVQPLSPLQYAENINAVR